VSLYLLQVSFIQIPLLPGAITRWLFIFQLSLTLTTLILFIITMLIKMKHQRIIENLSKHGWFIFAFIGAVIVMVPSSFLFHSVETTSPISISTMLVYLFTTIFTYAGLKWREGEARWLSGFVFILIGGIIYFLTFLFGEILPASYSWNVTLYQPERPPGWYIMSMPISALHPLEALHVYLVFTMIVVITALPAVMIAHEHAR